MNAVGRRMDPVAQADSRRLRAERNEWIKEEKIDDLIHVRLDNNKTVFTCNKTFNSIVKCSKRNYYNCTPTTTKQLIFANKNESKLNFGRFVICAVFNWARPNECQQSLFLMDCPEVRSRTVAENWCIFTVRLEVRKHWVLSHLNDKRFCNLHEANVISMHFDDCFEIKNCSRATLADHTSSHKMRRTRKYLSQLQKRIFRLFQNYFT